MGSNPYSTPSTPSSASYQNNPYAYAAFNTSPQANQAMAQIGNQTAQNDANAQSLASQMGAGRSAGNTYQLQNAQAQGAQNQANVANNMALQSFNSQLGQMNAQNAFNQNEQNLSQQQYANQGQLNQAEQARQAQMIGNLPLGNFVNMFANY